MAVAGIHVQSLLSLQHIFTESSHVQALSQKGTSRLLANLPKEEDRRLPLKKLLESMKELQDESNAQQLLPPRTTSLTQMRNGPPLRSVAPGELCSTP